MQMLSERHNSNAIVYWLSEWVRAGAPVPREVIVDDSAALISALCRAFGGEPSTQSYVDNIVSCTWMGMRTRADSY